MNAQDLVLNIAVNMARLSKWAMEGKEARVKQFMDDTENYLAQLENVPQNDRFKGTYIAFKRKLDELKNTKLDELWAEDALTWASILTHRAKLA